MAGEVDKDGDTGPAPPLDGSAPAAGHDALYERRAALFDRRAGRELAPGSLGGPAVFARMLWRVGAAHVSGGNQVALLRNGPATFDAMLELIAGARTFVGLESYIFHGDEVGERFADALIEGASRGVETRLIFDWIGSRGTRRELVARMRRAGVRVGVFNHLGLGRRWLGIVPRDHRKLLVVDDAAGVISGVGIGHEWTRGSRKSHGQPWRDTAIRIAGPAAVDMRAAFERMWARIERPGRRDKDATRPTRRRPHEDEPAVVGIVEGEPGRFRIARGLQIQAALADRSIWVADAYFVPSFAEVEALTGAARDGVDVRLLVPSRADHNWTIGLTRRYYRRLLRNGVRIWEWQGEMMHAKTSVVDGLAVRVGSTDFNPLGVAINFELDALVRDEGAGAAAEAMFLDDLDASREVQLVDGRPVV